VSVVASYTPMRVQAPRLLSVANFQIAMLDESLPLAL
jgi:hypothetical protein